MLESILFLCLCVPLEGFMRVNPVWVYWAKWGLGLRLAAQTLNPKHMSHNLNSLKGVI